MQTMRAVAFERKRRFLIVLPILIIPFLTAAFWAIGGVSDNYAKDEEKRDGLNVELPDAKIDELIKGNKLSFYDKVQEDSMRLLQQMRSDPFYTNGLDTLESPDELISSNSSDGRNYSNRSSYQPTVSQTEASINERLDALNKVINNTSDSQVAVSPESRQLNGHDADGEFANSVNRLENMMQAMEEKGVQDPEMEQLSRVLDKIADIQQPKIKDEKVVTNEQQTGHQSVPVKKAIEAFSVTCLCDNESSDSVKESVRVGFFHVSIDTVEEAYSNVISAVVHETQTVSPGSTIKLRLTSDISMGGRHVTRGQLLYGTVAMQQDRLAIRISTVRDGNSVFPVALSVYDMDGLEGLYIVGSVGAESTRELADQTLQQIQLMSVDPSLKAQAASVGLQAAKRLLATKNKAVKVTVKAGYKLLLKEENKNSH